MVVSHDQLMDLRLERFVRQPPRKPGSVGAMARDVLGRRSGFVTRSRRACESRVVPELLWRGCRRTSDAVRKRSEPATVPRRPLLRFQLGRLDRPERCARVCGKRACSRRGRPALTGPMIHAARRSRRGGRWGTGSAGLLCDARGSQASGISRPKASKVIAAGSGPPRRPVSRPSIAAISSAESPKSNTLMFSAIRLGLVDFGMTERSCCRPSAASPGPGSSRGRWRCLRSLDHPACCRGCRRGRR
jgi:hypothetical protein